MGYVKAFHLSKSERWTLQKNGFTSLSAAYGLCSEWGGGGKEWKVLSCLPNAIQVIKETSIVVFVKWGWSFSVGNS